MRRAVTMLATLGCVLVLGACPTSPGRERVTDVDRQRMRTMLDEPIIQNAERVINSVPGTLLNPQLGWDRGEVSAELFATDLDAGDPPATPEEIEDRTEQALQVLRSAGWTIMSTSCEVPDREPIAASALPSPEPGELGADPGRDVWTWSATAYKHTGDVSYWADLSGAVSRAGDGFVDIGLLAPNVSDPPDLFPDRPPGLPMGSTCIEEPGVPPTNVEQGTRIEVDERADPTPLTEDPTNR